MVGVLFVCTGNICRSPTAEGVFRAVVAAAGLAGEIRADSAGTHDYHTGEAPDARSAAAAARRGIDLGALRARRVAEDDFTAFDLILAMDRENLHDLRDRNRGGDAVAPSLFLDHAPALGRHDVPDPYYGGENGFELVLDLVEAASAGLLAHIRATYLK